MKDNLDQVEADDTLLPDTVEAIGRDADFGAPVETALHRNVVLRAPEAIRQGRVAVATDALAPLSALGGQTWFREDSMSRRARGGVRVSAARHVIEARHDGAGLYGPATGRRLRTRVLWTAASKDGRLTEIWRVTDRGGIFAALGLDPERWAADMLAHRDAEAEPLMPALDEPAMFSDPGDRDGWGAVWSDLIERAMEGAFGLIDDQYDPAADLALPGTAAQGARAARSFWLGLRAAFPSARFEIAHRMGVEAALMPPRAALRWSLTGRHDGWGAFGAPTGAEVHLTGLSQAEFGPQGVRREWTLYDPGAVWMQILLGRG
ncbi:ester cyclase [Roseivivax marinus]|uniref:ester cyclase n=1 Tax=Roseivivax marinus TaxID=1379903 RepID=UPI001F04B1F1|nr:ester cyclase [Roseivivax marinus]UMA63751.1 ester cyclase [Roseivivax marinus]